MPRFGNFAFSFSMQFAPIRSTRRCEVQSRSNREAGVQNAYLEKDQHEKTGRS